MTMVRKIMGLMTCCLGIIAGCGSQAQLTGLKDDTIHLRARTQVIQDQMATRSDVDSLRAYIRQLERTVREQMDLLWSMRADVTQQVSAVDERLQVLDAKVTETIGQFSRLTQKVEGVKAQLTASTADTGGLKSADPEDIYNMALTDFQRGNYELAIRQFTQYLEYFPASDLADDAQYWIGDCYYNQRQYTQALEAFDQVLKKYPKSNKIPATLLRIGFTRLAQNDAKTARTYLQRVIAEYPGSEEATLARMRLDTLTGK
jgi:tol-pal system protein YbgF